MEGGYQGDCNTLPEAMDDAKGLARDLPMRATYTAPTGGARQSWIGSPTPRTPKGRLNAAFLLTRMGGRNNSGKVVVEKPERCAERAFEDPDGPSAFEPGQNHDASSIGSSIFGRVSPVLGEQRRDGHP